MLVLKVSEKFKIDGFKKGKVKVFKNVDKYHDDGSKTFIYVDNVCVGSFDNFYYKFNFDIKKMESREIHSYTKKLLWDMKNIADMDLIELEHYHSIFNELHSSFINLKDYDSMYLCSCSMTSLSHAMIEIIQKNMLERLSKKEN